MNLAAHPLHIIHICYLALIEYLYRNFLIGEDVNTFFDLSEGALSECFGDTVATDFNPIRLW